MTLPFQTLLRPLQGVIMLSGEIASCYIGANMLFLIQLGTLVPLLIQAKMFSCFYQKNIGRKRLTFLVNRFD